MTARTPGRAATPLAAVAVLVSFVRPVSAQEPAALETTGEPPVPAVPAAHDLSDVAGLEAWLDGFMASHLEELPSAGASVAIVRDGEVLLAKGFGYADVEDDVEVGPSTLFRIGSVSKLFTWTAVMQLVERGVLDLDTDINEYMGPVQVPATYAEPITLKHLLTHTAGFEDHVIGLFGRDESDMRPLEQILTEEMPVRVRPPGEAASYSNHGTGMAAYIVERASGMSFSDYMQQNILDPLGMDETTILQPLPENLAGLMSTGYSDAGQGEFDEEYFEFVPLGPVGAVSSSANDMAKLMIAYLQGGRLGDARILEEETVRRMQEPLYQPVAGLNSGLYGFMDMSADGQRIFGHGGDTFWFHTLFAMMPEHDVGVFVSYNTDSGSGGRGPFMEAFLERYFPVVDPPEIAITDEAIERAERYAGNYRANRYVHSDFTKVAAALGPLEVKADSGTLRLGNDPTRFRELSPGLYREEDGYRRLAFRDDETGQVEYMFLDPFQIVAYERLYGVGAPAVQTALLIGSFVVFGLALVFWPVASVVRWRFKATPPPARRIPRWARVLTWCACLSFFAFMALLAIAAGDFNEIALGEIGAVRRALGAGLVAAILGVITAGLAIWFWIRREGSLGTRIGYTIVAVAALVAIWQMSYWNLLGFRL